MILTILTIIIGLVTIVFIALISILIYIEIRERMPTEKDKDKVTIEHLKEDEQLPQSPKKLDKVAKADDGRRDGVDLERFWKKE